MQAPARVTLPLVGQAVHRPARLQLPIGLALTIPSLQEFVAAHPMSEEEPQMSSWNGGITQRQLAWLRGELSAAEAAGERVLVASHHQVGRGGARPTHMAWNWQEVQEVRVWVGGLAGRWWAVGEDGGQ